MLSKGLSSLAPVLVCLSFGHNALTALAAEQRVERTSAKSSHSVIHGILYNEDDSHRFRLDPEGTMKPKRLDRIVDALADSQVTVMLICCNGKKAVYDSKAWEIYSEGFDPAKDDSQAFFGNQPLGQRADTRQFVRNLQIMLEAGVCPMQRMIDRCRNRGISPWVSVRMNDAHEATVLKSPEHSRFWMEHPEFHLPNHGTNVGLNYGIKPVRDHYMALLREVCDRFDMDGLELDWNRFCPYFVDGEEVNQSKVLTKWMGEVRQVVRAAEKKWKHRIYLAARVPARPEVSMGLGLDAVTWTKLGLIDHLIVAPFWVTTDFDVPVERWSELLKDTGVGVTVGLEQNVRAYWNEFIPNTPELRRGAAMAALGRGSQGIYLFNYFNFADQKNPALLNDSYLFKEMGSIESLLSKDRSYTITYVDIDLAGKPIPGLLPKKLLPNESADFSMFIGPKPLPSVRGKIYLRLSAERSGESCEARVTLNGQPPISDFTFGSAAFREGYNTVRVVNTGKSAMTAHTVKLSLQFPSP